MAGTPIADHKELLPFAVDSEMMKIIPANLLDSLLVKAGAGMRRRTNHNIHEKPEDPIHRLLVAAKRDSYFRPHRHPKKWELVVVLRGQFDILQLDDMGAVTHRISAGPKAYAIGFELPANTWHVSMPMADDSVFLEIKQGPYDAHTVSEFADWSPPEGAPGAGQYAERLRQARVGDSVAQRIV